MTMNEWATLAVLLAKLEDESDHDPAIASAVDSLRRHTAFGAPHGPLDRPDTTGARLDRESRSRGFASDADEQEFPDWVIDNKGHTRFEVGTERRAELRNEWRYAKAHPLCGACGQFIGDPKDGFGHGPAPEDCDLHPSHEIAGDKYVMDDDIVFPLTDEHAAILLQMGLICEGDGQGHQLEVAAYVWDDLQLTGKDAFELFDRVLRLTGKATL